MDGLYECAFMTHLLQFSLKTQDINLTHFKLGLESRDVNGAGPSGSWLGLIESIPDVEPIPVRT